MVQSVCRLHACTVTAPLLAPDHCQLQICQSMHNGTTAKPPYVIHTVALSIYHITFTVVRGLPAAEPLNIR